jgi:hypothetical protein
MNHLATPGFWFHSRRPPPESRELADRCFATLQADPRHPSLRLKKVGDFWSARIGLRIRALGNWDAIRIEVSSPFWIFLGFQGRQGSGSTIRNYQGAGKTTGGVVSNPPPNRWTPAGMGDTRFLSRSWDTKSNYSRVGKGGQPVYVNLCREERELH